MAYKSFKGKWRAFGDEPAISILPTGLICLNKACYETFVRPTGHQSPHPALREEARYVKLYYDPYAPDETKKIAFELRPSRKGDFVLPIKLIKTGLLAVIRAKTFLDYFDIKYKGMARSYPAHQITIPTPGYKRTRRELVKGIEIRLDEYIRDKK